MYIDMEEKLLNTGSRDATDESEIEDALCTSEENAAPPEPADVLKRDGTKEVADKKDESCADENYHVSDAAVPRRALFAGLVCCLLAVFAVVVLGSHAAHVARRMPPFEDVLLAEVFGKNVARRESEESEGGNVTENGEDSAKHDTEGTEPLTDDEESEDEEPIPPKEDIMEADLSVSADAPLALVNESGYTVDCEALLETFDLTRVATAREKYGSDAPLVLILHTHGTEAYSENAETGYRSLDAELGVVSVGREMKRIFESHGIGVIHNEEMIDAEDFDAAYVLAAEKIKSILGENPSICCVLDIHRDAICATNGAYLKVLSPDTVTEDGIRAAQIMLVVGTDAAGSGHENWRENLAFALAVQKSALAFDPSIMRTLNLRAASFNQQYAPYSVILEVGSAANSVEEAKLGGIIAAESIIRVIEGEGSAK